MAALEENSALFPIFILTIMALALVSYTILKSCRGASKQTKSIHCKCSDCSLSGKYRRSLFKRISNFATYSNLTLVLLWFFMIVLVYYIKSQSIENQVFDSYDILGLEPEAPDSEIGNFQYYTIQIKIQIQANKYFVEKIVKTYQALTDPVSR